MDVTDSINSDLLKEEHEKILVSAIYNLKKQINDEKEDFKKVLDNISSLYTPLNNFFDNVMVNVADIKIKGNRLAILKQVLNTLKIYADFSKIQK